MQSNTSPLDNPFVRVQIEDVKRELNNFLESSGSFALKNEDLRKAVTDGALRLLGTYQAQGFINQSECESFLFKSFVIVGGRFPRLLLTYENDENRMQVTRKIRNPSIRRLKRHARRYIGNIIMDVKFMPVKPVEYISASFLVSKADDEQRSDASGTHEKSEHQQESVRD